VNPKGVRGNAFSPDTATSSNGRFIAFESAAANLAPGGDTNAHVDVFVRDRWNHRTRCVSVNRAGHPGNAGSENPWMSADGRWIVFASNSSNLVSGDTNGMWDVFVRDLSAGVTERASLGPLAQQADGPSRYPSISADGRFVAFESYATNLAAGDSNSVPDVFVRDRWAGTTERASVDSAGAQSDLESSSPAISADGRFVAFASQATNLVAGDTNAAIDVFVRDRLTGTTERVSVSVAGAEAAAQSNGPSISSDGRVIGFASQAGNLVPGDANGTWDVFVRDLAPGCSPPASYCAAIPNSSGQTASIGSTGWASFGANNLVLACSGLPGAVNGLFFHGTTSIDPGVPFGNGVRCVGGAVRRLGLVQSVNGVAMQAQDLGSSAYGGIVPGSTRYFEFWHRDPAAGGAAFNASDGLAVVFCN